MGADTFCYQNSAWLLGVNGKVADNFWYNRGAMDWKTLIAAYAFILTLLFILHQLIVKRRDATIEAQDREITRLKTQLAEAKDASPDVLAERYKKKIDRLECELKELQEETATNSITIEEKRLAIESKEQELEVVRTQIEELTEHIEIATEVLEEYKSFRKAFSCPYCEAELLTREEPEEGSYSSYACGYCIGFNFRHPCPHDPEFPTFDEYELEIRTDSQGLFRCFAKPKTMGARKLGLESTWGRTIEQAKERMLERYRFSARNVPKKK